PASAMRSMWPSSFMAASVAPRSIARSIPGRGAAENPSWQAPGRSILAEELARQDRRDLAGVRRAVVRVAVVHQDVCVLRVLGDRADLRGPLLELVPGVQVAEPFGGGDALRLPRRRIATVEADDREIGGHGRDRGHAALEALRLVDHHEG